MVIVVDCGDDVQHYAATFATHPLPRPPSCPSCSASGALIGHGSYPRTVAHPTQITPIRIRRLLCTACHHTVSLLPSFCLPWRHYASRTVQTVLTLRVEAHASWSRIAARFAPAHLVAALPHLLVALREAGVHVANGSERWLATLWQWGNGRKLGRVI